MNKFNDLATESLRANTAKIFKALTGWDRNAWINIESAKLLVSDRLFGDCTKCANKNNCKKCGKNESNHSYINTANSDCDAISFYVYSNEGDGLFCFWHPSFSYKEKKGLTLNAKSLPVVAGHLQPRPYRKDTSMLFISDSNATINSDFFNAGIGISSQDYSLIVWLGKCSPMDGEEARIRNILEESRKDSDFSFNSTGEQENTENLLIAPLAMMVIPTSFLVENKIIMPDLKSLPSSLRKSISDGSGEGVVRTYRDRKSLALANCEFNDSVEYIKNSWFAQYLVIHEPDEFVELVNEGKLEDLVSLADSLRIRGMREEVNNLVTYINSSFKEEIDDTTRFMLNEYLTLPPGCYGVMS